MGFARPGFMASQEPRADLNGFRAERKRRCDAATIPDPASSNDGLLNRIDDLRNQRKRADQRLLGRFQERGAMSARIAAGSDDHIDVSLIQGLRFFNRGCGSNRDDFALPHFRENLRGWYAEDEAKNGR